MKQTRKLLTLLLALALLCTLATTAFAAETGTGAETANYNITAPNNGHTYEVYQIFTGDLHEGKLSNVKWGANGKGTPGQAVSDTVLAELGAKTSAGDAEKLAAITPHVNFTSTAFGTVTGSVPLTNVPAGYYLIKDASFVGTDDAYSLYIVQIVNNVAIAPKAAKPTVDKQVHDETSDAEAGATNGWGESADHAINESFQFKLTATLPSNTNFAAYSQYKVVFTDTMSDGVTFESIDSVTVDGVSLEAEQYDVSATKDQKGGIWTLTIDDIKFIAGVNLNDGADIVVIYNAHLNESAYVNHESGGTENKNSVYLEYSNNPNVGGEEQLGKTPEDSVWVFTYQVNNTKVDGTSAEKPALAGAGFKLYDFTGTSEIGLIYDSAISAYRPIKSGETPQEMMSAENGVFNIRGLDAGTYILKETTEPAGYNKCKDIEIVISATHAEAANGASACTDLTNSSNMSNTIENKQGSTLPETGGIGTTIFYTLGGVLVMVAVVLLVTKKRMNGAEM